MKKLFLLSTILLLFTCLSACRKDSSKGEKPQESEDKHLITETISTINSSNYSKMIPVDTANRMIQSYLNSINYLTDDSKIRSLIYNADTLRKYLADTSIKNIKIIFAHSLDYINSGGINTNCGYNAGALTVVLVGYNRSGNYIIPGGMVPDRFKPCPHECEINGTAASDLIQ